MQYERNTVWSSGSPQLTHTVIRPSGVMVASAVDAATLLAREGIKIRVLDMHTIKPIDEAAITAAAEQTGALVVAEEHLHHGGLGSVVAQVTAATRPVPIEFVNVGDTYAESGDPDGLLVKYGLTAENVVNAVRKAISRKA